MFSDARTIPRTERHECVIIAWRQKGVLLILRLNPSFGDEVVNERAEVGGVAMHSVHWDMNRRIRSDPFTQNVCSLRPGCPGRTFLFVSTNTHRVWSHTHQRDRVELYAMTPEYRHQGTEV